ncbi:MAG: hypothetical protein Q7S20_12990 [Gemmatimonadaceae bacterium]|nr:hypothetical protein [Gemmatimonadaceae bacterium]
MEYRIELDCAEREFRVGDPELGGIAHERCDREVTGERLRYDLPAGGTRRAKHKQFHLPSLLPATPGFTCRRINKMRRRSRRY